MLHGHGRRADGSLKTRDVADCVFHVSIGFL